MRRFQFLLVLALPGIREGIEERNWKEAQDNISVVAKTIEVYTSEVKQATSIVKPKAF